MSTSPDRAAARCACTNISLMQLFHELKQKFPGAPDHAVSGAISAYCHDKRACETHLESQAEASLTHAYHASSSAAARRLKDLRLNLAPIECRNRPIEKGQFPSTTSVLTLSSDQPQNAQLSSSITVDDNSNNIEPHEATSTICIEERENQRATEVNNDIVQERLGSRLIIKDESPITINIDSCVEKNSETASDAETEDTSRRLSGETVELDRTVDTVESVGNTNYRIFKSNKIKNNLNERLEKIKEKKIIKKSIAEKKETVTNEVKEVELDKPKRPCTLEFIKSQPDPSLKRQIISETEADPCRVISPVPLPPQAPTQASNNPQPTIAAGPHWPEQGFPLNLSVNVNCHMDIANRARTVYSDPWFEDYESPRAITSVNLTVCTPTSAMQSPEREAGGGVGAGSGGFEGHVTVTVSPSAVRPPRRHAPPPPSSGIARQHFPPTHTLGQSTAISDGPLIARQRARKKLLVDELARERERLARIARETAILAAPLAPALEAHRLRGDVEWLREQCQRMTRQLDIQNAGQEVERNDYYREVYAAPHTAVRTATPLRPAPAPPAPDDAPSWQCHVCTFRNHGLLNKCEECDMPRILLVRSGDEITVRVMPGSGRRKIVRSWVL